MSLPTDLPALTKRRLAPALGRWVGIVLALWLGVVMYNRMRSPPALGVDGGRLLSCPDSPNCVCSQDADQPASIEPLRCSGTASATEELNRLETLVASLPRMSLLEKRPGYLRFEARTAWLRFRDDVEFLADDAAKLIHVRSASRVGHSDLGANRRRVEAIRARWSR